MAPLEKSNCSISLFTDKINKKSMNQELNAYPNPFVEYAYIALELESGETTEIKVYNSLGKIVHSSPPTYYPSGTHNYSIEGANLTKGLYIVIVKIGNEIIPIKLLKQ